MTRMRTILGLLCLSLLSWNVVGQEAYIIASNGERVDVEKILARPNGDLVVTINSQPRDVARNQYRQAVGVKPDGFDAAVTALQQGDEAAEDTLQGIVRKSAYQSWDVLAGKALIETSLQEGSVSGARRIYEQLEERYGDLFMEVFPEMEIIKWNLQIADGDTDGLMEELTQIVKEGDNRIRRGMAQVARGDLKRRQREFQSAVLDYLRTVYFYSSVPELHAEALYKTAATFSDIGDTGRMRTYQQTLKQTYPDSRFATMPLDN